nr:MFS transporter [Micromonospora sp. M42]
MTASGLPRRVHLGYALGSLVTGAFGTVPGLLLLPYLTDTLGVAAGLAALLVLLPKAWDVLVNPVAGRISDRTRSRWGARRPYLLVGGLALAVLFASIFAAPFANGPAAAAYVALAFLATATAFAFFQVPYVAMPVELTADPAERTRLMTWRDRGAGAGHPGLRRGGPGRGERGRRRRARVTGGWACSSPR